MELKEIQKQCYQQACDSGWNDKEVPVPEMIALIHSEASEALEEYRNNKPVFYAGEDGKPEGIASEFADILIRMCHYAELLDFDLENAVLSKMSYNTTRPYRHGGKKA